MRDLRTSEVSLPAGLVLAGDLLCFLIFALLGLRSHEDGITASGLLRAAVPFQAGWLVFSVIFGLPGKRPKMDAPGRVLMAWVPAWLLGLALRSLVFGRAFSPTFAGISFLVNAILLLIWRTLLAPRILKQTSV
ncbi:MAG: DUF3054 family protein [Dehalococcoidia bacterium]|nr:DUF3054 family protein [Dehalococcoidia bacterium]